MPTTKRKVQKSMGDKVFDICNMIFWIIFLIIIIYPLWLIIIASVSDPDAVIAGEVLQIGRASCRDRVCAYV